MKPEEIQKTVEYLKEELNPLFAQIGQAGEWGYEIFKRQVYVNAFSNLLWFVPGIFLMVGGFYLLRIAKNYDTKDKYYEWPEHRVAALVVGVICILISLNCILLPIGELIQVWLNPDYATIKLIFKTINTPK